MSKQHHDDEAYWTSLLGQADFSDDEAEPIAGTEHVDGTSEPYSDPEDQLHELFIERIISDVQAKKLEPLKAEAEAAKYLAEKLLQGADGGWVEKLVRRIVNADRGGRGELRIGSLRADIKKRLHKMRQNEFKQSRKKSSQEPLQSMGEITHASKWGRTNMVRFTDVDDDGNVYISELELANALINDFYLHRLYDGIWGYSGRCYRPLDERQICAFVQEAVHAVDRNKATYNYAQAVYKALFAQATARDGLNHMAWYDKWNSQSCIPFRNVIVDLKDIDNIVIREHSPEYLCTYWVDCDWDENANDPIVSHFLTSVLPDVETRRNLVEWMGYTLAAFDMSHQKMAMLLGNGENGKGKMLTVMSSLLANSMTSVSLQQLAEDKFAAYSMSEAVVNVYGDMSAKYIDDTSLIKQLTGNDPIRGERKFRDPFVFRTRAKSWLGMNKLPPTSDTTHGFFRRLLMFPFKVKFDGVEAPADPLIEYKITTESAKSTWARIAVLQGYVTLVKRGKFKESEEMLEVKAEYRVDNDLISAALAAEILVTGQGYEVDRRILHKVLDAFAEQEGKKPISVIEAISRLQQRDSSIRQRKVGPREDRIPLVICVGVGDAGRELKIEQKIVDRDSGTIELASTTVGELYDIKPLPTNEEQRGQTYEGRTGISPDYVYQQPHDDDDDEI